MSTTFSTFGTLNPEFVDMERDGQLRTAQNWTMHVLVPEEYNTAEEFYAELMSRDNTFFLAACGGDSFHAWGEKVDPDENDTALHLYFQAPDLAIARAMAAGFVVLIGLGRGQAHLSAAGDWAEQAIIPTSS